MQVVLHYVGSETITQVAEKHALLKLADHMCIQAVRMPQRCKEEKLEDRDRKRDRETKRTRSVLFNDVVSCWGYIALNVRLRLVFLEELRPSPVSVITPILHTHISSHLPPTLYNLSNWQRHQIKHSYMALKVDDVWFLIFEGMIVVGEHRSIRRKPCPIATLSTRNPTWLGLGVKL
jgi:hypothetical protein